MKTGIASRVASSRPLETRFGWEPTQLYWSARELFSPACFQNDFHKGTRSMPKSSFGRTKAIFAKNHLTGLLVSRWLLQVIIFYTISCLNAWAQQIASPSCGITIICHGNSPNPELPWVKSLALEASKRQGRAPIYRASYNANNSFSLSLHDPDYILDPIMDPITEEQDVQFDLSANGGIVLILDWSAQAHVGNPFAPKTQDVADSYFNYLFGTSSLWMEGRNPVEVPIHLIGHSRGGSLVSRFAGKLAERGLLVDQMTTLDAHPVTGLYANDWPVEVYDNVIYCDNYYRDETGVYPTGVSVSGAKNYPLNGVFHGLPGFEHELVHVYYHGTCDVVTSTDTIRNIQSSWYPGSLALPFRAQTGYNYSRFGRLIRLGEGINPQVVEGTGPRVEVYGDLKEWPNIAFDQTNRQFTYFMARLGVTAGESVYVPYWHSDQDSSSTVTFFLDNDTNPFNNSSARINIGSETHQVSSGFIESDSKDCVVPITTPAGDYYIGAEITDGSFRKRYDYVFTSLTIKAAPSVITVSPAASFSASGNQGGPFSPSTTAYSLRNAGGTNLSWAATKNVNWLSLATPSGTLTPGQSGNLALSINTAAAHQLAPGTHTGKITITAAGKTQEIPVSLIVFQSGSSTQTTTLYDMMPRNTQGQFGMRMQYRTVGTSSYTDLVYSQDYSWNTPGTLYNIPSLSRNAAGSIFAHPSAIVNVGHDRDIIMKVANTSGPRTVRITGTAGRRNTTASVTFSIYKGASNWNSPFWTGVVGNTIDSTVNLADGEELLFSVNANGHDGADHALWNDVSIERVGPGINPPVASSPGTSMSPGQGGISITPTFAWQSVAGATGYGISVRDTATNAIIYTNDGIGNLATFTVPGGILTGGKGYAWKIRARNAYGWTPYSAELFFQPSSIPLPAPQLWTDYNLSSSDLTASCATIHWAWSGSLANTTGIAIAARQLNPDGSDGPLIPGANLASNKTVYSMTNLVPATRYRINVAYQPQPGYQIGSTAMEFYTRFPTPSPLSPASGATVTGPMAFSWQSNASLPVAARIEISETATGFSSINGWSNPFDEVTSSSGTAQWNGGVNGQTYWWSVRQASSTGYGSGTSYYSTPRSFVFNSAEVPLDRPRNTTNTAGIFHDRATLTWSWAGNPAHASRIDVTYRRLNNDGSDTNDVNNFSIAANQTSAYLINLLPDTLYRINVAYQPVAGYLPGSAAWSWRTMPNNPPNIVSISTPSQLADGRVRVDFNLNDAEGDTMSCRISLKRAGSSTILANSELDRGSVTNGSNTVFFTASEISSIPGLIGGNYQVNLRVEDPVNTFVTTGSQLSSPVFTYTVPNTSPSFNGPSLSANATEDLPFDGQLSASDTDVADVLVFQKTGGPDWLDVAPDGSLSGTPINDDVGVNTFGVRVTDLAGTFQEASLTVTVQNTNDVPEFNGSPINLPSATEASAYTASLVASASDPDFGDSITFSKESGPTWLNVSPGGVLSGNPGENDIGNNLFVIRATDSYGAFALATLVVNVENVNNAPIFSPNSLSVTATTDSLFVLNVSATDSDVGDVVTYSKQSGPAWLGISETGFVSGVPTASDSGINSFVLRATDSQGLVADFNLQIEVVAGFIWTNPAGGSWPTSGNWLADRVADGLGAPADFSTLDLADDATVLLDGNRTISGLLFGDVVASHSWILVPGSGGSLTLSSATGVPGIVVNNQSLSVGTSLAGTQGIVKRGPGALVLTGNNSFTGQLSVAEGLVNIRHSNALGGTSEGTKVETGCALEVQGGLTLAAEPLVLSGTGIAAGGALRSISGNNTIPGPVQLTGHSRINSDTSSNTLTLSHSGGVTGGGFSLTVGGAGNTTINGPIATGSASLVKEGTGTFRLAGSMAQLLPTNVTVNQGILQLSAGSFAGDRMTGSGVMTVNGPGTLLISSPHALGGASNGISERVILDGGTLTLNSEQYISNLELRGATINGSNEIRTPSGTTAFSVTGTTASQISARVSNAFSASAWSVADVSGSADPDLVVSGSITGSFGLVKNGGGTMALTGNNTFSGPMTINQGGIQIGNGGSIGLMSTSSQIINHGTLAFNHSGLLQQGTHFTAAPITGTGGIEKLGSGTVSLNAVNTYSGDTTVKQGVLALGGDSIPDNNKVVISGGRIELAGGISETVGRLFFNGTQQANGTWGSSQSIATNKDDSRFSGAGILVVVDGPNHFSAWIAANAPGQTADQDHDQDGVPNGIEYFMGTSGNQITANPALVDDTVTWPRNPNFIGTFAVQTSSNLVDWTDVTDEPTEVTISPSAVIWMRPLSPERRFVRLSAAPK